jgi:hypothetical protein
MCVKRRWRRCKIRPKSVVKGERRSSGERRTLVAAFKCRARIKRANTGGGVEKTSKQGREVVLSLARWEKDSPASSI